MTSRLVSCGVFLFGLLSLVVPCGYSIGPALLVLLSGYGLLRESRTLLRAPRKEDVTVIGVMHSEQSHGGRARRCGRQGLHPRSVRQRLTLSAGS